MKPDIANRNREIVKYNIIGIIMNLILSVFKIVVGLAIRSGHQRSTQKDHPCVLKFRLHPGK